jgi:hypothetical protein
LARAKRTDRTEARRRYRAEQLAEFDAPSDGDDLVHDAETAAPAPARRKGTAPSGAAPAGASAAAAGARPVRPSFSGSARAAYRAPNVREDLAALPRLLIHWSVLVSAAVAIVGTGLFLAIGTTAASGTATTGSTSTTGATTGGYIASMMVSLFVGPPPFGAALLIGFMLPRATWLVGLVFGLLASACFTAILLAQPADATAGSTAAILGQVWLLGPLGTMFFAAGIAWYKRFLDLLNPNRGQRGKAQPKPQSGRGNAPRNRLSGSSR